MGFTLDTLNMPVTTIETIVSDVCNALYSFGISGFTGAVDSDGNPLLVSALPNVDSVLIDAINGTPLDSMMPCARINYTPLRARIDANVGGPVEWKGTRIEIYVLYYYGNIPSQNVQYGFNTLRNRHLRLLQNFLRFQVAGNTQGIVWSANHWKWDNTFEVEIDCDTPFKYIDETVKMGTGYACARMDYYVSGQA
jgi:hypothetical protein